MDKEYSTQEEILRQRFKKDCLVGAMINVSGESTLRLLLEIGLSPDEEYQLAYNLINKVEQQKYSYGRWTYSSIVKDISNPKILDLIINKDDYQIRDIVARHPAANGQQLLKLTQDTSATVRDAAIQNLTEKRQEYPEEFYEFRNLNRGKMLRTRVLTSALKYLPEKLDDNERIHIEKLMDHALTYNNGNTALCYPELLEHYTLQEILNWPEKWQPYYTKTQRFHEIPVTMITRLKEIQDKPDHKLATFLKNKSVTKLSKHIDENLREISLTDNRERFDELIDRFEGFHDYEARVQRGRFQNDHFAVQEFLDYYQNTEDETIDYQIEGHLSTKSKIALLELHPELVNKFSARSMKQLIIDDMLPEQALEAINQDVMKQLVSMNNRYY